MKSARTLAALVMAATVLGLGTQSAAAAQQVEASGTSTPIPGQLTFTVVSSNGQVAIIHIVATSTFTGTFTGTSVADDRCVEQLSTGNAFCTGQEMFTGSVAGRTGTVVFQDAFSLNFNTGETQGQSAITGGTANARGVLTFSGNAFAPLPYQGDIVLT